MAEEAASPTGSPAPIQWTASPLYRIVHSNLFRYRIDAGTITFHFDSITDQGPAAPSPILIGEVSVAMSWSQAKALFLTLQMVIPTIEREIGPIAMPTVSSDLSSEAELIAQRVRSTFRK
jgi:hypothetical protein